nr:MAG TPA: hypothetical protein [Caudoviricetes sp.]
MSTVLSTFYPNSLCIRARIYFYLLSCFSIFYHSLSLFILLMFTLLRVYLAAAQRVLCQLLFSACDFAYKGTYDVFQLFIM